MPLLPFHLPSIEVEYVRFSEVIHLLDNSIKATKKGRLTMSLV